MVRVIALSLFIAFAAAARSSPLPEYPFVYVDGAADRDVPPTNVQLSFEINAVGKSAESVVSTVTSASASALKVLLDAGVQTTDMDASEIDKKPKSHWDSSKQQSVPDGYEASRSFSVTVRDLKSYPVMITRLFALPHTTEFRTEFDTSEKQNIEKSLMEEAARKARESAANVAASFGMAVKGVRAISEEPFPFVPTHFGFSDQSRFAPAPLAIMAPNERTLTALLVPATINVKKQVHAIFELQ